MKKYLLLMLTLVVLMSACSKKETEEAMDETNANPLLIEWDTPFGVPPFDKIELEHYMPAVEEAMAAHKAEIEAIVNNPEEPTFENTIIAYDQSGRLMTKVQTVFYNLSSAETNPQMDSLAGVFSPILSAYGDKIMFNEKLFARIKAIHDKKDELGLDPQQLRVLNKYYSDFERNGANLSPEDKEILGGLNKEIAELQLNFGQNVTAETNKSFRMVIENEADLAGLPESVIAAAAAQAEADEMSGKWVFTLQKPSCIPFLQYAENKDLREKIYRGYFMKGNNDNEFDNKDIVNKLVNLRLKKAKLLGFEDFASYRHDVYMAKNPANVYAFLNEIWTPALNTSKNDLVEMQAIADAEGNNVKFDSWDWWFYSEKLRKAKYDLDEESTKPYFSLDQAIEGYIYVLNKLYGVTFEKTEVPVYHKDAFAYEVKNADGSHLGVFYMDFYPREGKRSGAWCTNYRGNDYDKDGNHLASPIVSIVCNFTPPVGDSPALLSLDELTTLFHEGGHAIHFLFADGRYYRTQGDVPRDFVELPSQVMEKWAVEPEVLKVYAKHYKTGEVMPDELINKIEQSGHFNQGFVTTEYIAASILDMDWHVIKENGEFDVQKFEEESMKKIGLIPEILPRYRSTYFQHSFTGGYTAGYYVYLWAAKLDADAFAAFKETGDIFNQEYAEKFRYMLTHCGDDDGMVIYKNFRGQDPSIEPLLKARGFIK